MKMIIGLGNPGKEYVNTKHNVGFMVIDAIAKELNETVEKKQCQALTQVVNWDGEKILLVKPQTYMNLSGQSVMELLNYYNDRIDDLLVIHDDLDLPPGQLRFKQGGGAGGHNGIKNIIAHLGTNVFQRIKVGVGEKPKEYDLADYVLGHFSKEDKVKMEDGYKATMDSIEMILMGDIDAAMNRYNKKVVREES